MKRAADSVYRDHAPEIFCGGPLVGYAAVVPKENHKRSRMVRLRGDMLEGLSTWCSALASGGGVSSVSASRQ